MNSAASERPSEKSSRSISSCSAVELPRHHFELLGLVAGQALGVQILGQHQVDLVAHVGGRQA